MILDLIELGPRAVMALELENSRILLTPHRRARQAVSGATYRTAEGSWAKHL